MTEDKLKTSIKIHKQSQFALGGYYKNKKVDIIAMFDLRYISDDTLISLLKDYDQTFHCEYSPARNTITISDGLSLRKNACYYLERGEIPTSEYAEGYGTMLIVLRYSGKSHFVRIKDTDEEEAIKEMFKMDKKMFVGVV